MVVRLSYSSPQIGVTTILEENHYYPFGMKHINYGMTKNKYVWNPDKTPMDAVLEPVERSNYQYKYNGKEYQDEFSLNWYDYQARNYDPAIGRWMNIDPLAELSRRFNPYAYALNNPVYFVDPDGMSTEASNIHRRPVKDFGWANRGRNLGPSSGDESSTEPPVHFFGRVGDEIVMAAFEALNKKSREMGHDSILL